LSFKVIFLQEAEIFIDNIEDKARAKILYNIRKSQLINDKSLFKKVSANIWEFRTNFNKTQYRLFAFWDKREKSETLVISTHGIMKKTQRIPMQELRKAESIRMSYLNLNP
jgi:phage-related protein